MPKGGLYRAASSGDSFNLTGYLSTILNH